MSTALELFSFENAAEYISSILPFLEINEAANGPFIATLDQLKKSAPASTAFMAEIKRGDEALAAAVYRERNLIVTQGLEPGVEMLAKALLQKRVDIPGIVGPSAATQSFAQAWAQIRGCEAVLTTDQGLYRLNQVDWPIGIPGRTRVMTARDIELVAGWIYGFYQDALPFEPFNVEDARKNAKAKAQQGMTFIWEVDDKPAAMASLARPTRRGIAVNAVYTPPEYRRRGYATALVAAVSDEGLNRGKEFCVLYTDLANATSNSIYQKIGYRLLSESKHFLFTYSRTVA